MEAVQRIDLLMGNKQDKKPAQDQSVSSGPPTATHPLPRLQRGVDQRVLRGAAVPLLLPRGALRAIKRRPMEDDGDEQEPECPCSAVSEEEDAPREHSRFALQPPLRLVSSSRSSSIAVPLEGTAPAHRASDSVSSCSR